MRIGVALVSNVTNAEPDQWRFPESVDRDPMLLEVRRLLPIAFNLFGSTVPGTSVDFDANLQCGDENVALASFELVSPSNVTEHGKQL